MISRIYVMLKDGADKAYSYLIDSKLGKAELAKLAQALTNPILEKYFINEPLQTGNSAHRTGGVSYAVEIGFKPGVTDNAAHTVKEIARDLLKLKDSSNFQVYTSKIFLISGNKESAERFAAESHNPLIERVDVAQIKNGKVNFPNKAPKVVLKKTKPVINVPLNVSDEELINIGTLGIKEGNTRRGPLALDLASMHTIKEYFARFGRNPTDIELETLAQTWSEHCKHTIFANRIDDIEDGLYKTYIKGATNLIRKQKGKDDFCVSVFSDNSGGIIFDKDFLITHKV